MKTNLRVGLLLATTLLCSPFLAASQEPPTLTFTGQVRPRMEARTPVTGSWDSFTSMRVRGSVRAVLEDRITVFVQFQDVRLFGEEGNTLSDFNADNLDLHEGFLEMKAVPGLGGTMKVGRQELALGEQRLVGSVNWTQQGRSFDGIHYSRSLDRMSLQVFGMKLTEASSMSQDYDSDFFGGWGSVPLGGGGSLDLFGLLTRDARADGADEKTVGGLWRGEFEAVSLRAEGSVQGGTRGGEDVSAFMMGVRAGTTVPGGGTLTLWYDYLSGDEAPNDGESGAFNTLFATNHPFYGLADYFTNIPLHTGGLGLTDAALKFTFTPLPGTGLNIDLHRFRTAEAGTLTTRDLGNELDVTFRWTMARGLSMVSGYSFFEALDGMAELGRLTEDAHWMYVMLDAVF